MKYLPILNKTILIFIIGFIVSIFLRLPNFNQPFGRHHEWLTAHVLITNKIWFDKGISASYYSPIFKHDTSPFKEATIFNVLRDKEGYEYYISYPPFCFIASYIFFKLSFIQPSILGIQVFSLILHFISSFLILLIGYLLANKKVKEDFHIPSLLASFIYVFSTNNLWFHHNVYFADMLAQPLFIGSTYLLIKLLKNGFESKKELWALGIVNFLLVYTEWIGIFFDFTAVALLFLWHIKSIKKVWIYLSIISITGLLSLGLTVYQYSRINGWDAFIETEMKKYEERSGKSDNSAYQVHSIKNPYAWDKLADHYLKGYSNTFSYIKICFILFVIVIIVFRKTYLNGLKFMALLLAIIPILLHNYILFDFNATHDFSTLKSSFIFSLLIFIMTDSIICGINNFDNKIQYSLIALLSIHFIYFSYKSYKDYCFYNNPKDLLPYWKQVGEKIKEQRQEDELVFIREWGFPELIYYSDWIPHQQLEYHQAVDFLKNSSYNKGIYFYSDKLELKRIIRFNTKGDSTNVEVY